MFLLKVVKQVVNYSKVNDMGGFKSLVYLSQQQATLNFVDRTVCTNKS